MRLSSRRTGVVAPIGEAATKPHVASNLTKRTRGGSGTASRAVGRGAVLRASAECNELGEEFFLVKYGYGQAKEYFVVRDGEQCSSKAVYGVTYRFIELGRRAMHNDEFSGGEAEVTRPLRALGFEVTAPEDRNPKWSRDEVTLALVFYMACNGNPPDKGSTAILGF